MLRQISMLSLLVLMLGSFDAFAQAKKAATPSAKPPGPRDPSVSVTVYMRDGHKNELLVGTRIWPDNPEYTAQALQRFFALMKALGPAYKQDDEVAYTWGNKGRVTKCTIYLESAEAGVKGGTGAAVGCEANGVSTLVVPSGSSELTPSASQDPKHLNDVLEMFKKQSDRARSNLPK